jgi:FkbM family methyltransferase
MVSKKYNGIFTKLSVWFGKPIEYKVMSISVRTKNILSWFIVPWLKLFHTIVLKESRYYRQAVFQTAEPNSLLISNCQHEVFIVSPSDKVIARDVFIEKSPYDFEKFQLVNSLLGANHKRTTLIDIGANIGTICIPAITRGIFHKAVAIEPEPFNFNILAANIAINDLNEKIQLHNVALGVAKDEFVIFELSDINYGDHRVQAKNNGIELVSESARKTIKVKSTTLDHLIGTNNPSDTLIWMDVQGFEGYVLAGASDAMSKQIPICLEFWPYGLNRSGCYLQLKEAIINNGYKFFYNLNDISISPISITEKSIENLYNAIGQNGEPVDLLI